MFISYTLWHGDCLELMKDIPDKSVDMVLCDLPYGTTQNKWDKKIDLEKLFAEYKRIVKSGGVMSLFSQPPFNAELMIVGKTIFRYEWIWQKSQGTGFLNANRMPLKIHENILIFYDKLPTYNPQFQQGKKHIRGNCHKGTSNYGKFICKTSADPTNDYYPTDIVIFNGVPQSGCKKFHPTQKPVPLLEYLIKTYTNEGETVLDNCMGSGSTGVACLNTNRDFIGIELNDNYFEIAADRIMNHTKDTKETFRKDDTDNEQMVLF